VTLPPRWRKLEEALGVKELSADLHIHTALSPCASPEMTPATIAAAALRKGMALIAICDHNAAGNVAAVQEAARFYSAGAAGGPGLAVLAGMEITTAEEVHVLGLFPETAAAEAAARTVQATLPESTPASRRFGEQRLLTAEGEVRGREPRMLAAASTLPLAETVRLIKRHGGLAIASHIDRPSFSVLSQLGLFPTDAGFDAVEVSGAVRGTPRAAAFDHLGLPVLMSSDSHFPGEIGEIWSVLRLEEATFAELAMALRRKGGREARRA
jgi:3',5'-nucleoside bisphosphate phosphatase